MIVVHYNTGQEYMGSSVAEHWGYLPLVAARADQWQNSSSKATTFFIRTSYTISGVIHP
jgi:hypothetical protein